MKRLLDSPLGQGLLAWLAASYIRLVWATSRWHWVGREQIQERIDRRLPTLCCFWHGRILMMPKAWIGEGPFHMLISGHRDGRLIARVIRHFDLSTVVGSSSRGALGAMRGLAQKLRDGAWAAITPDGPRGPRMRAQAGVVAIARLGGAPILPVAYSTTRAIELRSWDRMLVPLPFGRGVFVLGAPIEIPADADPQTLEALRRQVEDALVACTRRADEICGRVTPDPADRGR
jgi:lysophospholipid acyltransferase (LPLAT)-like uncharacterized protein